MVKVQHKQRTRGFLLNSNDHKTSNTSLVDNNHVTDVSTSRGVRLVDLPDRLTKRGMGFADISKFAVNWSLKICCVCVLCSVFVSCVLCSVS